MLLVQFCFELHFAVDMIEGYETKTELQVMVLSIWTDFNCLKLETLIIVV